MGETDLISRHAAYATALAMYVRCDTDNIEDYRDLMCESILALPSVQTEIIRCRDCKHWDKTWTNDWSPNYHYCPMIDGVRKGDFYCADAERRTDGTDAHSDIG